MTDLLFTTTPIWLPLLAIIVGVPFSIITIAGAWALWRGGGGTAITSLQATNRILEERVKTLEDQSREKDRLIAELKGRTDVTLAITPALAPILDWTHAHEARAQERHEATLAVLQLVADRLSDATGAPE
jgi:hypothetical protein